MPNDPTRIEIITGRERRRRYSAEQKLALVEETMQPDMTVSAVARLRGVSPSLLFKWRQLMTQGGQVAVKADDDVVAASRARELEQRVRELERLLGRKTMEVEILKEALTARIRRAHFVQGKTIKAICREFGIARNTIRRILRSGETSFAYQRDVQPRPKLGQWTEELDRRLLMPE